MVDVILRIRNVGGNKGIIIPAVISKALKLEVGELRKIQIGDKVDSDN